MILRKEIKADYTPLNNHVLKDRNLTNELVGVLCRVLSLPDNWDFYMKGLSTILGISQSGVNRILKRLALYGYFRRERFSLGNGRFDYNYIFYDESRLQNYIKYYGEKNFANLYTSEQLHEILPEEYFESIRGI